VRASVWCVVSARMALLSAAPIFRNVSPVEGPDLVFFLGPTTTSGRLPSSGSPKPGPPRPRNLVPECGRVFVLNPHCPETAPRWRTSRPRQGSCPHQEG